jgi:Ca2+-binding RTX toxin-like protein
MGPLTSSAVAALLAVPLLAVPTAVATDGQSCGGRPATIVGTAGDDALLGSEEADVIVALAGNDVVQGLGGDDVVCGGEGTDTLLGGPGDDVLLGGLGAGVLDGGPGDDRLVGSFMISSDPQSVAGGQGRDRYFMRFVMQGGATLYDTTGTVDLRERLARVHAVTGKATMPVTGIEEVQVARKHWTLIGGRHGETLIGGAGRGASVVIHAGGGRDLLRGTRHHDLLDGGRGVDTVLPSGGHDTCRSIERQPSEGC